MTGLGIFFATPFDVTVMPTRSAFDTFLTIWAVARLPFGYGRLNSLDISWVGVR